MANAAAHQPLTPRGKMESRLSVRSLTIAAAGALLMFAAAAPHTQGGGSATSQPPQGSPPAPQAPARGNRGGGAPGGGTIVRGPNGEMWGYSDSAFNAGSRWRVHDPDWPQPPVVTPAGPVIIPPPSDAIVLFDGKDLSAWVTRAATGPIARRWAVRDGYFESGPGGSISTRESFGDVQCTWNSRRRPRCKARARIAAIAASPSWAATKCRFSTRTTTGRTPTAWRRQSTASTPPLVNAARRPGEWQSYDIVFEAPRFTGLPAPGSFTILWNGIVVHDRKRTAGHDDGDHDAAPVTRRTRRNCRCRCNNTATPCTSATSGFVDCVATIRTRQRRNCPEDAGGYLM